MSKTPCARLSAQLVDKSVDGRLSTCGEEGGRTAVTSRFPAHHLGSGCPPGVDGRKSPRNSATCDTWWRSATRERVCQGCGARRPCEALTGPNSRPLQRPRLG